MGTLRLYLAICVAAAHAGVLAGWPLIESRAAVLVFFCISGFLMALLCCERYTKGRWIAAFYTSRALRIFPLYWIVLCVVVTAWATGLVNTGINFTSGAPLDTIAASWSAAPLESKAILIFTNLTTLFQEALAQLSFDPTTGLFTTDPRLPPKVSGVAVEIVGLSWTLGVELLFYLLAPFIVRSPWRVAALAFACLLIRYSPPAGMTGFSAIAVNFGAFTVFLPFFLLGASLYHMSQKSIVAVAGILISTTQVALYCAPLIGWQTVLAMLAMASIPLLCKIPKWSIKLGERDAKLGDLSYPLYITHFFVMQACREYAPPELYGPIVILAIAATAVAACLCFDRPLRHLRHRIDARLCEDKLRDDNVARSSSAAGSRLVRP